MAQNKKNGNNSPMKIKLLNTSNGGMYKHNFAKNFPKGATVSKNNGNSPQNKVNVSIQDQRRVLPVYNERKNILELIKRFDTLILMGETGSGKTTQVPQIIYNFHRNTNEATIAITQPRRVAAISIAQRVAKEIGCAVGGTVGYSVRFEDATSDKTKICFLTDGMLLREAMNDFLLKKYSYIILDEAHERTINTDILFGVVKKAQKKRRQKSLEPLKIIIMSATMDVDHFSKYFNNCQVVYLEGRTYPVTMYYTTQPHDDYQTACVSTFFRIHQQAPANHDVLIFLTGEDEIDTVCSQIRILAKDPDVSGPAVKVCPLYAAQSSGQQMSVFAPAPKDTRKVIVATNIAETSVTISGVKYVIDSGMVKARTYHPTTGFDMLKVQRISQEQAWQRTGRAGRESEGFCYRLYTRSQFDSFQKSSTPEILRANLASVALQLLALRIHMVYFDFMDKPPKESMIAAFEQLKLLGAIESEESENLTALGQMMAKFPLEPRFSKILLSAPDYGCLEEALTIVALLSGESIFLNPVSRREAAQEARKKFHSPLGDHVTLLNVYREFNNLGQNKKVWCHEHFMNMRNLMYAREVRIQLLEICKKCNLTVSSCGSNMDLVRKCLLTGLFMNVAELHTDKNYITLDKRQVVKIHPSSNLHGQKPHYILFTEVVQTSKCYLRSLSTIKSEWLEEVAPDYLRTHNLRMNPHC